MKGTRDSDNGAIECPLAQMLSCEEMLNAKQTVSKRTICLKIAARIATETNPVTEAQLSALMTLIFAKGQK
ncbi:TPA: hypothetical protein I8271_001967 [Kluyvera intermedia]|uniref:Uncharacterized protein n=2 Tax=Enterobacteriaceae TaxID=543 RepID=A0AAC8TNA8_9ENTR|nr:hypothetical protein [Phytobacter ursingii]HAT2205434.1 hypothetical protein [Kluyvera intermedia]AKL13222.1 hypothetical protein AB182_18815 [Phytobacter ursingii]HAT2516160.1 hypothetical protein [Kluyvera intermedia]HAT2603843.1 hypothetical protein [Kluyvera intermedia]HAT2680740.1 hypothetical protein [Kluyvera intermedia]